MPANRRTLAAVDGTPDVIDPAPLPRAGIGPERLFATTHWAVVLAAGKQDAPEARIALETLCQTYWRPLYVYARRRGYSPADAQDHTQSFFVWVLERDWLKAADRQRGRFRCFLQTSFNRFLADEWDRARAKKRGGDRVVRFADVESWEAREPVDSFTPEQSYEWHWAVALLDEVVTRLAAEYASQGKAELFEALRPCLMGERTAQPYSILAPGLGMTEASVKVLVYRLRRRYRELLRDEIANTVTNPDEIEEEIRYLQEVLARP